MKNVGCSVFALALMCGGVAFGAAKAPTVASHVTTDVPGEMTSAPGWAPNGQDQPDLGFAPLSVTRNGVAYATPTTAFDPADSDKASAEDFPAWASTLASTRPSKQGFIRDLGRLRLSPLPEPAAWVLILVGVGMIGSALRGLLVADRKLRLLREAEENPPSEPSSRP